MMSSVGHQPPPELSTSQWLNTDHPITLDRLRGDVVVIEAFQMLCPGCVSHGIPQAMRIDRIFGDQVTVLGLHTVFEHHDAMTPVALEAFLHEYRVTFPVGVDQPGDGTPIPETMQRYELRGTPSLLVFDRQGHLRANAFGQADDLAIGALLGQLTSIPAEANSCSVETGCLRAELESRLSPALDSVRRVGVEPGPVGL